MLDTGWVRLVFNLWLLCGCMLRVPNGCGSGAVRFSVATGALVLRWLSFRHSYGGCGRYGGRSGSATFDSFSCCGSSAARFACDGWLWLQCGALLGRQRRSWELARAFSKCARVPSIVQQMILWNDCENKTILMWGASHRVIL